MSAIQVVLQREIDIVVLVSDERTGDICITGTFSDAERPGRETEDHDWIAVRVVTAGAVRLVRHVSGRIEPLVQPHVLRRVVVVLRGSGWWREREQDRAGDRAPAR